ncbi:SDR family oxidoreductase [Halalkalibaculum sp. DA384]|uniref:SDR family oxidoreductase n=1 Tax=Halalkalibaculum sp. DA384 TaxID=3373606 RepID=UPI003755184F
MYEEAFTEDNISQYAFLVTGGAGFIGSNIVEYLVKQGAGQVRVLDNLSTGRFKNIEEFVNRDEVEFMEGDISDPATCREAVQGMNYVSHQAALGSVPRSIEDPLNTNNSNITGFLNMLVAARDEPSVKKMVYAASSSTYGDSEELPKVEENIGKPLSPYAVTKYVNELYADVFSQVYDFNTIGLRYFNVFGPHQDPHGAYAAVIPIFMQAAIEKETPTINGDGLTTRDFTYVSNAVQANIKALLNTGELNRHEVVNIACNEQITLNELWETISKLANVDIEANHGPERPGDVRHSLADISKAERLFDYNPGVYVKEGLEKAFEHYKRTLSKV